MPYPVCECSTLIVAGSLILKMVGVQQRAHVHFIVHAKQEVIRMPHGCQHRMRTLQQKLLTALADVVDEWVIHFILPETSTHMLNMTACHEIGVG